MILGREMNHIEKQIEKYHIYMGHEMRFFWNKERSRIYIYDCDIERIIGSCKNSEYIKLCNQYNIENDISYDVDTLYGLMGYSDFSEEGD